MLVLELFFTFLKIGLVSFGGGYAVIPLIQFSVEEEQWMTVNKFQETVALAGMAPGPIATNTATLIGYQTSGIWGAIASTLGIIFPSLLIIIILAGLFSRMNQNKWFKSSFYGLRPTIVGLIAYAAIHFGFSGISNQSFDWTLAATILLCAAVVIGIIKYKLHPLLVIVLSAGAGIIIF